MEVGKIKSFIDIIFIKLFTSVLILHVTYKHFAKRSKKMF